MSRVKPRWEKRGKWTAEHPHWTGSNVVGTRTETGTTITTGKTMIAIRICWSCRFFQPIDKLPKVTRGFCRRYPPVAAQGVGQWPVVPKSAWCGEYEKE